MRSPSMTGLVTSAALQKSSSWQCKSDGGKFPLTHGARHPQDGTRPGPPQRLPSDLIWRDIGNRPDAILAARLRRLDRTPLLSCSDHGRLAASARSRTDETGIWKCGQCRALAIFRNGLATGQPQRADTGSSPLLTAGIRGGSSPKADVVQGPWHQTGLQFVAAWFIGATAGTERIPACSPVHFLKRSNCTMPTS